MEKSVEAEKSANLEPIRTLETHRRKEPNGVVGKMEVVVVMKITFSMYARRYGLLHVGRVRWHSRARQLQGRIVPDTSGRVNGNM
jgi:hypothetical protein